MEEAGWSGSPETFANGDSYWAFSRSRSRFIAEPAAAFSGAASRGGEVTLKRLMPEEKQAFISSDESEWQAILATGAVRVLSPAESQLARLRHPDRIISSRMVRRWKPQEGVGPLLRPRAAGASGATKTRTPAS